MNRALGLCAVALLCAGLALLIAVQSRQPSPSERARHATDTAAAQLVASSRAYNLQACGAPTC